MCTRWAFAVVVLTNSSLAISLLLSPRAASCRTAISRALSASPAAERTRCISRWAHGAGDLLVWGVLERIARAGRAGARGETTLAPAIAQRLMQRVRSAAGDALSAREIAVLQLAARGLSNSEIAKELFVSTTTAKAHLVHIYATLGVNDRTAAVTTALERGIIRLDQT